MSRVLDTGNWLCLKAANDPSDFTIMENSPDTAFSVIVKTDGSFASLLLCRVQEGNVAIYYRNGALLPDFSGPGIHTCTPFVTTVLQITVRPETKILDPMKCTTKDGVSNVFKNVQVGVYQGYGS